MCKRPHTHAAKGERAKNHHESQQQQQQQSAVNKRGCETTIWHLLQLPARRAERLALRERLVGNALEVARVHVHHVAPPCLDAVEANGAILRVLKSEEDDDQTDSETCIQTSGQHIYHKSKCVRKLAGIKNKGFGSQLYFDHQLK